MLVIGLTGYMGAGKDWVADNIILPYLKKLLYNPIKVGFAD